MKRTKPVNHSRGFRACWWDESGDALVEYIVLIGTVAIAVMPVLIFTGIRVVNNFERMRNLVLFPIP